MVRLRGSTRENEPSETVHFGYEKASNDKREPDRVGSGVFCITKTDSLDVYESILVVPPNDPAS